jgi:hypothetical protein
MLRIKITTLLFIIFSLTFLVSFSQSNDDIARALFQKAQEQFENKQFSDCDNNLKKIQEILGSPNPKILYLRIKNNNDAINAGVFDNSFANYQQLLSFLNIFFQLVDKNNYPPDKYLELVNIKLDVAEKMEYKELRKNKYLDLKKREEKFIKDTIDIYAQAFCADFNKGIEGQKNFNDKIININSGRPLKIEYDIKTHKIKAYYDKESKVIQNLDLLSFITIGKEQITFGKNLYQSSNLIFYREDKFNGKKWSFDLQSYISKIIDLKNIMDKTDFSGYYNHEYDDIRQ